MKYDSSYVKRDFRLCRNSGVPFKILRVQVRECRFKCRACEPTDPDDPDDLRGGRGLGKVSCGGIGATTLG